MNNKPVRIALITAFVVSLTGCFDLNQRLMVSESGDTTFNFAFTLDAAVLEITDESDINAEGTCDSDDVWDNLPDGLKRVSDVRLDGDDLVCEYTITGPLTKFQELSADIQRESNNADVIKLEVLDDHRARITSVYNFSGDDMEMGEEDSVMARSLKKMIASNFEGHYIRWAIAAPAILESNGDISGDGRSVTWSVPLEDAILNGGEYRFEAVIDYRNKKLQFF